MRFLTKATTANYAPGFYNLGLFYKSIQDYENAAKAFEQAFRIENNYYLARNNYGTTLNKMGRYKESINILEELVEMKQDYYLAHYNLACSLCLYLQKNSLKDETQLVVKVLNHLTEAFKNEKYIVEARTDEDLSYINSYNSQYYADLDTLCIFCTKKHKKNNK